LAMFHLFTHAFFKAMLFLGAGSVIHAMHHEQDMRNYGGLRRKIPLTFAAMLTGTLAITGVGIPLTHYGFAGFISKDAVIESAFAAGADFAFVLLVLGAAMTSFYSWRLMFMTFWGSPRGDHHAHEHAHESPRTMLVPLGVLALGAVFSGMVWYGAFFGKEERVRAWFALPEAAAHGTDAAAHEVPVPGQGGIYIHPDNTVLHDAHYVPKWVKVAPFIAMLAGLALAWQMYVRRPDLPARLAANQRPLYLFLLNKWYFDEIYDALFVRPAGWLGRQLWRRGDGSVIDGALNGVAMGIVPMLARAAARAQSGYVFHYAFAMVLGIAALVTWATLAGGN